METDSLTLARQNVPFNNFGSSDQIHCSTICHVSLYIFFLKNTENVAQLPMPSSSTPAPSRTTSLSFASTSSPPPHSIRIGDRCPPPPPILLHLSSPPTPLSYPSKRTSLPHSPAGGGGLGIRATGTEATVIWGL